MGKCRMQNEECRIRWDARRRRRDRRQVRFGIYLLSCILQSGFCICLTGCNVIGAVAGKVAPEPNIPAQFAPAKEPTLVLVENYHNPASMRLESDALARHLSEELSLREVAPVVEPGKAAAYRQAQGAAYRKMPLDAIGKAVGARQVIYVDLERFDVTRALASEMFGGRAEARVRVVDDAGELLWPIDSAGGYPVSVKVEPQRVKPGVGDSAVRQQLHARLADRLAKLFYNWSADASERANEQF